MGQNDPDRVLPTNGRMSSTADLGWSDNPRDLSPPNTVSGPYHTVCTGRTTKDTGSSATGTSRGAVLGSAVATLGSPQGLHTHPSGPREGLTVR